MLAKSLLRADREVMHKLLPHPRVSSIDFAKTGVLGKADLPVLYLQ